MKEKALIGIVFIVIIITGCVGPLADDDGSGGELSINLAPEENGLVISNVSSYDSVSIQGEDFNEVIQNDSMVSIPDGVNEVTVQGFVGDNASFTENIDVSSLHESNQEMGGVSYDINNLGGSYAPGEQVSFSLEITSTGGESSESYEVLVNGEAVSSGSTVVSGVDSQVITFTMPSYLSEGNYQIEVVGDSDQVSSSVLVSSEASTGGSTGTVNYTITNYNSTVDLGEAVSIDFEMTTDLSDFEESYDLIVDGKVVQSKFSVIRDGSHEATFNWRTATGDWGHQDYEVYVQGENGKSENVTVTLDIPGKSLGAGGMAGAGYNYNPPSNTVDLSYTIDSINSPVSSGEQVVVDYTIESSRGGVEEVYMLSTPSDSVVENVTLNEGENEFTSSLPTGDLSEGSYAVSLIGSEGNDSMQFEVTSDEVEEFDYEITAVPTVSPGETADISFTITSTEAINESYQIYLEDENGNLIPGESGSYNFESSGDSIERILELPIDDEVDLGEYRIILTGDNGQDIDTIDIGQPYNGLVTATDPSDSSTSTATLTTYDSSGNRLYLTSSHDFENKQPISNALVYLKDEGGSTMGITETNSSGYYQVHVPLNSNIRRIYFDSEGSEVYGKPLHSTVMKDGLSLSSQQNATFTNLENVSLGEEQVYTSYQLSEGRVYEKQIGNIYQLQAIQPDKDYSIIRDINASVTKTSEWSGGFNPIGNIDLSKVNKTNITYDNLIGPRYNVNISSSNGFNGTLEGNNNTIYRLKINGSEVSGIFEYISSGYVTDININDAQVSDGNITGVIAGISGLSAWINDVQVKGLSVINNSVSGGVNGYNFGRISQVDLSDGEVSSNSVVGGITGGSFSSATVSNVSVRNVSSESKGVSGGISGVVRNSTIRNSEVSSNVVSDISNDSQNYSTGGVAGTAIDSDIINVKSYGSVSGKSHVGGLVGAGYQSRISISVVETLQVKGSEEVGGLLGEGNSDIYKSYAIVNNVEGESRTGGLVGVFGTDRSGVGNHSSTVSNSYSASGPGSLTGNLSGGLIGINFKDPSSVSGSYWDVNVSDINTSAGGVGLTTSQMISENASSYMSGFSNDSWVFSNSSYPILKEHIELDITAIAPEEIRLNETFNVRINIENQYDIKQEGIVNIYTGSGSESLEENINIPANSTFSRDFQLNGPEDKYAWGNSTDLYVEVSNTTTNYFERFINLPVIYENESENEITAQIMSTNKDPGSVNVNWEISNPSDSDISTDVVTTIGSKQNSSTNFAVNSTMSRMGRHRFNNISSGSSYQVSLYTGSGTNPEEDNLTLQDTSNIVIEDSITGRIQNASITSTSGNNASLDVEWEISNSGTENRTFDVTTTVGNVSNQYDFDETIASNDSLTWSHIHNNVPEGVYDISLYYGNGTDPVEDNLTILDTIEFSVTTSEISNGEITNISEENDSIKVDWQFENPTNDSINTNVTTGIGSNYNTSNIMISANDSINSYSLHENISSGTYNASLYSGSGTNPEEDNMKLLDQQIYIYNTSEQIDGNISANIRRLQTSAQTVDFQWNITNYQENEIQTDVTTLVGSDKVSTLNFNVSENSTKSWGHLHSINSSGEYEAKLYTGNGTNISRDNLTLRDTATVNVSSSSSTNISVTNLQGTYYETSPEPENNSSVVEVEVGLKNNDSDSETFTGSIQSEAFNSTNTISMNSSETLNIVEYFNAEGIPGGDLEIDALIEGEVRANTTASIPSDTNLEPYLDVNITNVNDPVKEGDILNVTADITNTGNKTSNNFTDLYVDGEIQDFTNIALDPGNTTQTTLSYSTQSEGAGTVNVSVVPLNVPGEADNTTAVIESDNKSITINDFQATSNSSREINQAIDVEWNASNSGTETINSSELYWDLEIRDNNDLPVISESENLSENLSPGESNESLIVINGSNLESGNNYTANFEFVNFNASATSDFTIPDNSETNVTSVRVNNFTAVHEPTSSNPQRVTLYYNVTNTGSNTINRAGFNSKFYNNNNSVDSEIAGEITNVESGETVEDSVFVTGIRLEENENYEVTYNILDKQKNDTVYISDVTPEITNYSNSGPVVAGNFVNVSLDSKGEVGSISINNIPSDWSVESSQDDGSTFFYNRISSNNSVVWVWSSDVQSPNVDVNLGVNSSSSGDYMLEGVVENSAGYNNKSNTTVSVTSLP